MATSEVRKAMEHGPQLWPLSIQAYHTLGELGLIPENTELLYGQVFQKMSKSPIHSAIVRRLLRLLQQALPADCFLSSEQPITCADSEPEPDVAVIRGREEDFWRQHPRTAELVVEICVTSHAYDRSKVRAYAGAGVKELWFLLVPEKQIEVFRLPVNDHYLERTMHGHDLKLSSTAVPQLSLSLADLLREP